MLKLTCIAAAIITISIAITSPKIITDKRPLPADYKEQNQKAKGLTKSGKSDIVEEYILTFSAENLSDETRSDNNSDESEDSSESTSPTPRFSGFDKSLNGSKESFFLTNPHEDTLTEVTFEITYMTMKGEMLHKRELTHPVTVPPHETRRIGITSWDLQHQFYYYLTSPAPKRTATPFRVRFTPLRATYRRPSSE